MVSVCLAPLSTRPAAAGELAAADPVEIELPRERKQRRIMEELLGRDRVRRLDKANFRIAYHDHDLTPRLADLPDLHEEVADALLSTLGRLGHKAVLEELRLEERRDALRGKVSSTGEGSRGGRPKVRLSPRFRWDDNAWMGAKLRLKNSGSSFLSFTSLRVGAEVDGHNPGVKLAYEAGRRRAFLQYHGDHKEMGEAVELQIGFSF